MGGKSYRNSKKEREQEQRETHKQQKKRKRETVTLERPEPKLSESEKILIVCEGKNTEKSYFKAFKKMFRLANHRRRHRENATNVGNGKSKKNLGKVG